MIFIQNKYTTIYFAIINKAKSRNLITRKQAKEILGYPELHHIIPKSLGGDNSKENTIFLTAREHFICHWLLPKMLEGLSQYKMICAVWAMSNQESFQTRYVITSRKYEALKRNFSNARTGRIVPLETGRKISKTRLERKLAPWNKGRIGVYTPTSLDQMSKSAIGRVPWNKGKITNQNSSKSKQWNITDTILLQSYTITSLRKWAINNQFNANTVGDYARRFGKFKHFVIQKLN